MQERKGIQDMDVLATNDIVRRTGMSAGFLQSVCGQDAQSPGAGAGLHAAVNPEFAVDIL